MAFFQWLRRNSEHYLLVAAQEQVARRHGTRAPRKPRGVKEIFWLRVFAPVYRLLPWTVRHKVMLAMPGSHRRQWTPPHAPHGSAVQNRTPASPTQRERKSGHGTDRG